MQRHTWAVFGNFPAANASRTKPLSNVSSAKSAKNSAWKFPSAALFEEISHTYPEKSVRLKFFICQLLSGEPQPLDCAAIKWVGKSELDDYAFPAADAQLLQKLKVRSGLEIQRLKWTCLDFTRPKSPAKSENIFVASPKSHQIGIWVDNVGFKQGWCAGSRNNNRACPRSGPLERDERLEHPKIP